jgi:hypothetical protein
MKRTLNVLGTLLLGAFLMLGSGSTAPVGSGAVTTKSFARYHSRHRR